MKWSFFLTNFYRDYIESYLSGFSYSEMVQEQFEKMAFFLVDPLLTTPLTTLSMGPLPSPGVR
jgi:hypothetical protein